ncbi:MAG: DUF2878 family protein [Kiritimatiellae bacterium]|nr:DUF2878 family protein [Kiritimatiellia bacterium]MDD5519738.1 DUF2878 family protein [Kiritimatiellia bacterium]
MKATTVANLNTVAFIVISVASYQGALHGQPWAGLIVFTLLASLLLFVTAEKKERLVITVVAAIAGFILDSVLIMIGIYKPLVLSGGIIPDYLCPVWILALWLSFGYTLHILRHILAKSVLIAPIAGFIYALFIYRNAHHNKLVELSDPIMRNLVIIAVTWMILTPILAKLTSMIYKGKGMQNAGK